MHGSMLGVWAHPDDEAYLTAGMMAQAVKDGDRVVCITATRGEEGSWDEERWPTATMGRVREKELMASLEILGVTEHHWLDYHDGTCAQADQDQAIDRVAAIMREVQPDSVFSFGPEGMTGHADHKATCRWATEAFDRVAKPGAKLYYAVYTPEWVEEFAPRFAQFNIWMEPGTPPKVPADRLAVNFELPADILDLKIRAIEAHESQNESMLATFGQDIFREGGKAETFVLAAQKA